MFSITNNTVNQPADGTTAYGIRVDAGNGGESTGATVCLTISGNTTTGGWNASHTIHAPGIGLRQNHTAPVSTFNINGLSPNPAADGGPMEGYVNGPIRPAPAAPSAWAARPRFPPAPRSIMPPA